MPQEIILSEVLDRYVKGEKVSAKEAQVAVAAAAGVREEFMADALKKLDEADPRDPDYQVFLRVLQSMGDTLGRNGIVSAQDMSRLWMAIEMVR